ncbi:SOS response-associated peptidase [Caulifigura coniformis]|nr:SOS response-associated peptidase [Caulifigura coniformis]
MNTFHATAHPPIAVPPGSRPAATIPIMCARYNLRISPQKLAEIFGVVRSVEYQPRFNIAPTQTVVAIREQNGERVATNMRWGLVPSWSKDPKAGKPLIVARAETVATTNAFRSAFKHRRCLIPATGFYEWEHRGKEKLPYNIHLPGDEPFAFAGIWETWNGGNQPLESCAHITTEPNSDMAWLKDRMSVILHRDDWPAWLDPEIREPEPLLSLLHPWQGTRLELQPLDPVINSSKIEGEQFFRPLDTPASG